MFHAVQAQKFITPYIGLDIYFQTFLNQKHGYRPLQSFIPAAEFELLTSCLKDHGRSTLLLETWYFKDTNDIPPIYVLQPISSIIPGYKDRVGHYYRLKGQGRSLFQAIRTG